MEFEVINGHRCIVSMTDEEWHVLINAPYPDASFKTLLSEAHRHNEYFLWGSIGLYLFERLNTLWGRLNIPFRLRSDGTRWENTEKKLRLQTLEDWQKSNARRVRKPPS